MSDQDRTEVEREISRTLLERWDPLGVHDKPGVHEEYADCAPEIYSLLARGGSDTQVGRRLQQIEHEKYGGPEHPTRDLSGVLKELRMIERRL
jgi:hypothetical protein